MKKKNKQQLVEANDKRKIRTNNEQNDPRKKRWNLLCSTLKTNMCGMKKCHKNVKMIFDVKNE